MNRFLLLIWVVVLSSSGTSAPAQRASFQPVAARDLGLGMPKKPVPVFEPIWTAEAGVVFLQRSSGHSLALADTNSGDDLETINAADLTLGFQTGPYLSLSKQMLPRVRGEILYFGIAGWRSAFSAESTDGITTELFDTGSVVLDRMDIRYTSRLNNVELNTRFPLGERLEWLVGVRWTRWTDDVAMDWAGDDEFASVLSDARNDLYGMQLGIDGPLWQPASRFSVAGMAKVCLATNRMSTGRDASGTIPSFLPQRQSASRNSLLGELGLFGKFELTPRFALNAGYQVMWVDGAASGFSPIGASNPTSVLFHGLRTTIEARW